MHHCLQICGNYLIRRQSFTARRDRPFVAPRKLVALEKQRVDRESKRDVGIEQFATEFQLPGNRVWAIAATSKLCKDLVYPHTDEVRTNDDQCRNQ